jgi:hypothetical protein
MDWNQCPEVERVPGKVSGAWLFRRTRKRRDRRPVPRMVPRSDAPAGGSRPGIRQPKSCSRRTHLTVVRCASELSEVEVVATQAKVFDDVGDDAARNVAGMPREGE